MVSLETTCKVNTGRVLAAGTSFLRRNRVRAEYGARPFAGPDRMNADKATLAARRRAARLR